MSQSPSRTLVLISMLAAIGCGDTTGGDRAGGVPRFEFLTDMPAADTIQAIPETVLVMLRDGSDRPMARQAVAFETTGNEAAHIAFVLLRELDGGVYDPHADSTDANGRAGVLVYRGTAAGTAWLRVRAPTLALADSLPFVIRPGNPDGIRVTPLDTALQVSATMTIQGSVVDRFDNVRPEPVTFTAESSAVSVSGGIGTATVTGLAFGRASMLAVGAGHTRRIWVSVVPIGTLAFYLQAPTTGDSTGIGMASTDGSGYTALFTSPFDYASDRPLDWAPDGETLVFHLGTNSDPFRLYRITLAGSIQQLITQDIGGYPQILPRYGPNGWIYFTAQTDWSTGTDELWRVHADGSSPQRIGPQAATYESDTYAGPAPDGLHVWFSTDRPSPGVDPVTLAVLRVDSGTVTYLGFYGIGAVWSPLGDRVAFIDRAGAIVVAAPDGSAQRVVSAGSKRYVPYLDWSPDGKWIVASWRPQGSWTGGMDLIEPDLGLTLPLAFAPQWLHPAWRP